MNCVTVFYADQHLISFDDWGEYRIWNRSQAIGNREFYEGAYVFYRVTNMWLRMDATPVLLEDVPKQLRVLQLVLT